MSAPIRVMLVDDSAVVRGLVKRALADRPEIEIVASLGNGQAAVEQVAKSEVDVILLDIEMPIMDGLTALPKLLAARPGVRIIMQSTLTLKNADISLKALRMGAADYIPKPSNSGLVGSAQDFAGELVRKILALGGAAKRQARPSQPAAPARGPVAIPTSAAAVPLLRRSTGHAVDALAIGSSTGGPQALMQMLAGLGRDFPAPVFVTQHMPPTFTTMLAEHIGRAAGLPCLEVKGGEQAVRGTIYLAPGDHHMLAQRDGTAVRLRLDQGPPENFCRPAVDPMLRSLVPIYGARLLTVILTGMGHDGREGARLAVANGGEVIAQDEASSVVWGMPGAVAEAGLCSAILPISDIAREILKRVKRAAA